MNVILPTEDFILDIHQSVIDYYGGKSGILHQNAIDMAIERPKNYIYYEECNFHTVCAVILHTIARKHPFLDGNKRTALVVTIATYRLNGIELDFEQTIQGDFVDLMIWVVEDKPSINEISKKLEALTNQYAHKGARRALLRAQYKFDN